MIYQQLNLTHPNWHRICDVLINRDRNSFANKQTHYSENRNEH